MTEHLKAHVYENKVQRGKGALWLHHMLVANNIARGIPQIVRRSGEYHDHEGVLSEREEKLTQLVGSYAIVMALREDEMIGPMPGYEGIISAIDVLGGTLDIKTGDGMVAVSFVPPRMDPGSDARATIEMQTDQPYFRSQ